MSGPEASFAVAEDTTIGLGFIGETLRMYSPPQWIRWSSTLDKVIEHASPVHSKGALGKADTFLAFEL